MCIRDRVRVDKEKTEEIQILREIRQACILSPLLFNIYSEGTFREVLDEYDVGISLNGERINTIRYADDNVIFADTLEGPAITNEWSDRKQL